EILFGIGYWILPLLLLLLGIAYLRESRPRLAILTTISSFVFFLSSLGIVTLFGKIFAGEIPEGKTGAGGFLGDIVEGPLEKLIEKPMTFIFLLLFSIVSLFVIFNARPSKKALMFWKRFQKEKDETENVLTHEEEELVDDSLEEETEDKEEYEEEEEIGEDEETPKEKNSIKDMFGLNKNPTQSFLDNYVGNIPFDPPPMQLLSRDKGKPEFGDIKANTNIIKRTLQNFGISVEMDEVSVGPSVTRYSLKPAEGVKLSRIVGLQNDLSLALAAHPLRIEAPIPGKALVGIEIPNSVKTTVGLGTLLQEKEYQQTDKPLLVGLGKAINGKAFFANLSKMPHVLIAGTTGSGKSVTVHALINSLLFRNPPESVRFIMVDPKRVELTLYNNIPHLLTPVITDPKKAIRALKWATKEMERRYDVLETEKVRDIGSYHKNVYTPALKKYQKEQKKKEKAEEDVDTENVPQLPERMPYIVVIIDELADIMSTYPKELEAGIVRLAQMSRAVGIHLILSTQRPSVNIITGLIKANIPARIALQVSSQIDSRTILDTGGAEKLLGAGDMLYLSGEMSKPIRIQSAFITETEIKKVVKHVISTYEEMLPDEIDLNSPENQTDAIFSSTIDDDEKDDEDELYEEARELVIATQKASTSWLQRKLAIGYSRAARITDILEERGVIGPMNGSKPREVYEKPHEGEDEFPEDTYEE
ncbi:MAG: DNA translocase FtsK 4TM domain-containing protein, partial [Candidatus Pacebacteria bacterium]|nr:DNA translocase FtsK 4TM domain-containing protein [Candidatus Paceibacterota bacterium]